LALALLTQDPRATETNSNLSEEAQIGLEHVGGRNLDAHAELLFVVDGYVRDRVALDIRPLNGDSHRFDVF
jgi:hypothetical protein